MSARVSRDRLGKSIVHRSRRRKSARQRVKALEGVLNEWTKVARQLHRRCKKAERRLEEANRGRVHRFTDTSVGQTFKAMYEKATIGQCRNKDRLVTRRGRQERYPDFDLGSPAEVDRLVEASFPLVKFCVREIVS